MKKKLILFLPILAVTAAAIACAGMHSLFKRNASVNLFSLWMRKFGRSIFRFG
jgi:hypothetical protein